LKVTEVPGSTEPGVGEVIVADWAAATTLTDTGADGIPFATTTSVLAPVSMLAGIEKNVEVVAPAAIERLL
jgi:hypothetical protein